jgi:nucleoside-diphosphate-sugar epimerase
LRVAITGATGFIGRQVLSALRKGASDVFAISRNPPAADRSITWVAADLLNPHEAKRAAQETRADRLIHLAWTVEHGRFWTDPANLDWTAASSILVRSARDAGVEHITVIGTCFEYDWPQDGDCSEYETPTAPCTLYDTAKDACRRLIEAHARQCEYGFAWARVFYPYGEGEHPARLVPSVARALLKGEKALCSRGLALRDWMDVRDAGAAIAAVSLAGVNGPVNIASGTTATVAEIARRLGELALRPDLIELGALPDRPEPPRITANVRRLTELGYVPRHTLDQGLADALTFWRGQPAGQ